MPKSFQWIIPLLIENIYFAGTKVKGPQISAWIMPLKSIGPLGSMSKIQILGPLGSTSKFKSMDLWGACPKFKITIKILILSWPQVSMSCTHFFPKKQTIKKKKKRKRKRLHLWTTFGLDPLIKRYVGNLPRDSIHILIHNMTICIFIYMHHTFTTVKYWLQS